MFNPKSHAKLEEIYQKLRELKIIKTDGFPQGVAIFFWVENIDGRVNLEAFYHGFVDFKSLFDALLESLVHTIVEKVKEGDFIEGA